MTNLALALFAFVGTHFLMSHPLRAGMVARLGAQPFLGVYSLVSLATFFWAIWAFRAAPYGEWLWTPENGLALLATIVMFAASILLVGSFVGNPAMVATPGTVAASKQASGVFAITRHPMMWSLALWSVAHVLVSPRPAVILLSVAIAVLALAGSAGQDKKKEQLMGDDWAAWERRTAFVPFAGQLTGRIPWAAAWPGTVALVGGVLLWVIATWAHPYLGAPLAGPWLWL